MKDASFKAPPSTKGIIINKQLFARAKKDKDQKSLEKDQLAKLDDQHLITLNEIKTILVDKLLILVKGKTSQGVKNIYGELKIEKGVKFDQALLKSLDLTAIDYSNWTEDKPVSYTHLTLPTILLV